MKITNIEKVIMVILVLGIILFAKGCMDFNKLIKDNGGARNVIIEMGKDVKDIKKEIK